MLRKVLFFIYILCSTVLSAQISTSKLFADGMVLQQQTTVAIWGKAVPENKVIISPSWSENTYSTEVLKDSTWSVKIETPAASYQKYTIDIASNKEIFTLRNVLIGEVWLCCGQSNMALTLKGAPNQGVEGSLNAIVNSKNDNIRYFGVNQKSTFEKQSEVEGIWQSASPKTTGDFTAVGYFFAKKLQETLDVPIGIVACFWGGSRIEAWMSRESLSQFNFVKLPNSEKDNKVKMQTPTVLFNGMLNGITGYGMKGVLWYQGESNRDVYQEYPALFEAMHKDWEQRWNIGEFPIYSAQIAPFAYENMDKAPHSAFIREAQVKIADTQRNTGLIILMDVGDSLCIHPPKKQEVGERFAYLTLGQTYGMDFLDFKSPQYKSMKINDDKIMVFFDGLMGVTFNDTERTGFEIAGNDKVFYPATVNFDAHYDKFITLTSDKVPKPVAVRYAWKNYFKATLFGANGLPVSSFRSDDWEE